MYTRTLKDKFVTSKGASPLRCTLKLLIGVTYYPVSPFYIIHFKEYQIYINNRSAKSLLFTMLGHDK